MAITQLELARKLNVSQVAVSLAFREGHNRLSEDTRQRILAAAKRLGYQPNRLAAGLRGARTGSVGVIWAFADPWAGDAVIALDLLERLQARGFAVYQSQHNERVDVLCRQLDDLVARRVDALVIQAIPSQLRHPEMQRRLEAVETVVAVCREDIPELPCNLLIHDRNQAIRDVVDHLVGSGRRRLAMALAMAQESNPPKFDVFAERCRHHGLPEHPHMLIDLPRTQDPTRQGENHVRAMRRQFPAGKSPEVDAIFCFNDTGAMFVMSVLQDRGVRVPQDVAVVGFNNMEVGSAWRPRLASGDRMHRHVAESVERMLTAAMEDRDLSPQRETVHMKFIWRESAGGLPPAPVDPTPTATRA